MQPTRKRGRDTKCAKQAESRKRVKSFSPEAHAGSDKSNGPFLACPFYKHDPTKHMECLLRNRLTSTSFVRQHLIRAHCQPIHCMRCGAKFDKECEQQDHLHQARCKAESFHYPGFNRDQLIAIRKPSRDMDQTARWKHMWMILFPCEPCPDPYVGSAQEEILGIARRAVEVARLDTSSELLDFLNWDSISATYTLRSTCVDNTPTPSSHGSWPLTPKSTHDDAPGVVAKPSRRTYGKGYSTKPEVIQAPSMLPPMDSSYAQVPNVEYNDICWGSVDDYLLRTGQNGDTPSSGNALGQTPFFNQSDCDFGLNTPSSTACESAGLFTSEDVYIPWSSPYVTTPACSQEYNPMGSPEVMNLPEVIDLTSV